MLPLVSFPTLKKARISTLASTVNLSQQISCQIRIHTCKVRRDFIEMSSKLLSCYWNKCYLFTGYQKPGSNVVWYLLAHTEPKHFTWSSQESRGSWEPFGALQSYSWRSRWATATWWTGRTRETSLSFCACETWNTRWAGETWVSLCTFKHNQR